MENQQEQAALEILKSWLKRRHTYQYTVSEDMVCESARELGKMKSKKAIDPIIECLLSLGMDNSKKCCENVLVAKESLLSNQ